MVCRGRRLPGVSVISVVPMLLAVLFLSPCVVLAADNSFYVGAAFSDVSTAYDWRWSERGPPQENAGFKVIGGVSIVHMLSVLP
jgi:hypothetical protein